MRLEVSRRVLLAPGTSLVERDGGLAAVGPRASLRLPPAHRALWDSLLGDGRETDALQAAMAALSSADRLTVAARLDALTRRGLLTERLLANGVAVATREVISRYYRPLAVDAAAPLVLSRFACIHAVEGGLLVESPRCHAQVVLHGPAGAAVLGMLTEGAAPSDPVVALLAECGLAIPRAADGSTAEDRDDALRSWEFHDLLFHARSRRGRHAHPAGGTFRFRGAIEPPPVLKAAMSEDVVALAVPRLDASSFTHVLEERRSRRADRDEPLTLAALGEFLYRSARVRSADGQGSLRPYPSGGARHPLELYLAVDRCKGLAPGLYHYAAGAHHLERLTADAAAVGGLLDAAGRAQAASDRPRVLVVMAARFQRTAWKYETIAYALILKEVGALMQTMGLVATAMGLAACALGTGDTDAFARCAGLPYEVEGAVGELALR